MALKVRHQLRGFFVIFTAVNVYGNVVAFLEGFFFKEEMFSDIMY